MSFEKTFHARWGDMDFNAHMRNTAYLDVGGDVRMMYFSEHGFSMREFERRKLGPVILRDDLEYFRELRLLETYRVDLELAGLSADEARWRLRNTFYRDDGQRVARVTSLGGWLDLAARKMVPPPDDLAALIRSLPRTADYETISGGPKG